MPAGEVSDMVFPQALRGLIGGGAVISSGLYVVSDLLELSRGSFSSSQLHATYVAFVLVPFVMIGLHAVQVPRAGWLSLAGALSYGASFVFFAGTALYALVRGTHDSTAPWSASWDSGIPPMGS